MIIEITTTVLVQETQEADSIKMLNKKLDRFMDPHIHKQDTRGD